VYAVGEHDGYVESNAGVESGILEPSPVKSGRAGVDFKKSKGWVVVGR
jgi:hypothetical protein